MAAQTKYSYNTPYGVAGGIVDLAPLRIDSFHNEEDYDVMKFGIGVVYGSKTDGIKKPVSTSTASKFVGITVNGRTTQFATNDKVVITEKATVGVMRYGRIYAVVKTGVTVVQGDDLYLIISGDDAGKFTNASGNDTVKVNGRFDSASDSAGIAQVTLFDSAA